MFNELFNPFDLSSPKLFVFKVLLVLIVGLLTGQWGKPKRAALALACLAFFGGCYVTYRLGQKFNPRPPEARKSLRGNSGMGRF